MGHFVRIKTSVLIPAEDMPFPEKWNMKRLPKDVAVRPPSEGEDVPLESPAPKQGDKKKRKRAPSSPDSEKKKPKRRLVRKAKESTSALPSELVARVRTILPRTEEVIEKALVDTCEPEWDATALPRLHHEAFLRIRGELTRHEAEFWELTEKRDTYKLLSKKLQTELEAARKEHTEWAEQVNRVLEDSDDELDSVANDPILQVRQRLEQIGQLQAQVDTIQTEAEEFKKNMDLVTSQKEVVQAQLALAEARLRAANEKTSVQEKRIEELQSELTSAISGHGSRDGQI
ncbi:uncharacterized protein [Nicotiana tomentosiformis]|uniref:uncharacterized protein n=1 Tax=Nicotiana tomentosiformis TaxID=4098 RepID=UPI00388CAFF2